MKTKKLQDTSFKISTFKDILIVSLCFLIVYYFFIFDQISNYISDNIIITKKSSCKY